MHHIKAYFRSFKERVYGEDLKFVIGQGFFAAVIIGFMAGALQALIIIHFDFELMILIFAVALTVVYVVKKSFFSYHPIYPIIGVILYFIGYCAYIIGYCCLLNGFTATLSLCFNFRIFKIIFSFLNIKKIMAGNFNVIFYLFAFIVSVFYTFIAISKKE